MPGKFTGNVCLLLLVLHSPLRCAGTYQPFLYCVHRIWSQEDCFRSLCNCIFALATKAMMLACHHPAWQSSNASDFLFNFKKSLFRLGILPLRSEDRTHCRSENPCFFFPDPGPEDIDYSFHFGEEFLFMSKISRTGSWCEYELRYFLKSVFIPKPAFQNHCFTMDSPDLILSVKVSHTNPFSLSSWYKNSVPL